MKKMFLPIWAIALICVVSGCSGSAIENAGIKPASIDSLHIFAPESIDEMVNRVSVQSNADRNGLVSNLVPNLAPARIPTDIESLDAEDRKRAFIRALLPHIVFQNVRILEDRSTLMSYLGYISAKIGIPDSLRDNVQVIFKRYGFDISPGSDIPDETAVTHLLRRVDVIPVSLALAQAAHESGWGTSRGALLKNNVFGKAGSSNNPLAAFPNIVESVWRYFMDINTHPAYSEFRNIRVAMREQGSVLDPIRLATGLSRYSVLGKNYVMDIVSLIRMNRLSRHDSSLLVPTDDTGYVTRTIYRNEDA
ncbi:MAG: glucosaminidase domain-containing protein [Nitrospirae bacterium]|nr:glucosaminidase domain-containing protein [Nitrospirota bacterium]